MRAAMREVVGHDDEAGLALAIQLQHQREHLLGVAAIEIAGGLVGEHELRLRDQRARHGGALALAARELMRPVVSRAPSPTRSRISRARAFASALRRSRRTSSGIATFSSAENSGSR